MFYVIVHVWLFHFMFHCTLSFSKLLLSLYQAICAEGRLPLDSQRKLAAAPATNCWGLFTSDAESGGTGNDTYRQRQVKVQLKGFGLLCLPELMSGYLKFFFYLFMLKRHCAGYICQRSATIDREEASWELRIRCPSLYCSSESWRILSKRPLSSGGRVQDDNVDDLDLTTTYG